jgi:hypothetical protein
MRPSTQTRRAAGSAVTPELAAVVLIVFLNQKLLVLEDQPFDLSQIMSWNSAISSQTNGIEPELAFTTCRTNMNVSRFG